MSERGTPRQEIFYGDELQAAYKRAIRATVEGEEESPGEGLQMAMRVCPTALDTITETIVAANMQTTIPLARADCSAGLPQVLGRPATQDEIEDAVWSACLGALFTQGIQIGLELERGRR